ncbi:MAG: chromosome segregation protein ScpA [Planctomycetes bacterium]|nr:chromosome segregation protein ScpA [Planctomycetota bacterium]
MGIFQVEIDFFRGPLDLLLHLVRKHEVEITEVPLATIVDQYLEHLEVLRAIEIDTVGDFVELAATLVEMKSRLVLPHGEGLPDGHVEPQEEIVRRLLEYKRYRDAASMLDERGREWQLRYARCADDSPARRPDPAFQPIQEVELWDLVSAFGRIMRDSRTVQPSSIVYDDTPIQSYMESIHRRLAEQGQFAFSEMFASHMHKSALIGVFLAVLELVRHHCVVTEQTELDGEIWLTRGRDFRHDTSFASVDIDRYESGPSAAEPSPSLSPVPSRTDPLEESSSY